MYKYLVTALVGSLAAISDAGAATYHFSGAACQPERPSDYTFAWTTGAGIGNTDNTSFPATMYAVCPVVGFESATQTQTELKARLYDGNGSLGIGGFWQIDSVGTGTIWWSSIKYACSSSNGCSTTTTYTGTNTVRWTGSELFAWPVTNFSTYSFRALIPGRCYDNSCGQTSWVQSYWVSHNES